MYTHLNDLGAGGFTGTVHVCEHALSFTPADTHPHGTPNAKHLSILLGDLNLMWSLNWHVDLAAESD